jgi:hypothetical protein
MSMTQPPARCCTWMDGLNGLATSAVVSLNISGPYRLCLAARGGARLQRGAAGNGRGADASAHRPLTRPYRHHFNRHQNRQFCGCKQHLSAPLQIVDELWRLHHLSCTRTSAPTITQQALVSARVLLVPTRASPSPHLSPERTSAAFQPARPDPTDAPGTYMLTLCDAGHPRRFWRIPGSARLDSRNAFNLERKSASVFCKVAHSAAEEAPDDGTTSILALTGPRSDICTAPR